MEMDFNVPLYSLQSRLVCVEYRRSFPAHAFTDSFSRRMLMPAVGAISWVDLTVPDAAKLRDFYAAVVGWKPSEVKMGDYADYCMNEPASGSAFAGVCHARGEN